MKTLFRALVFSFALLAFMGSHTALAKSAPAGSKAQTALGNDISYPQCSKSWPSSQAFGVVGVTGGLANTTNSCLKDQLQCYYTVFNS